MTAGVGARLIANSRWSFLAFLISLGINFATIPIVISYIGLDSFGVTGLVIATYAPFMLIGTVLGQVMIKELSPLMVAGNFERVAAMLSAGLFLCMVGSIVVVVLLTVTGESLVNMLKARSSSAVDWLICFLVAGLGWSAQQIILVLQATFAAAQRYDLLARANIATAIVSAICILTGSMLWPGYLGFLLGMAVGLLMSLILWILFVWRGIPKMFPLGVFGRHEVMVITKFGKWQGSAHFAGGIGNQIDRYVLGALAPLSVIGQYNVAMRLQEVVHMGILKATEVLFPHFAVTVYDSIEQRASFYIRVSWLVNVLGAAALAPLIPLSSELISLWVSEDAADGGSQMLSTLAAAGILGCGVNVYYFFAIATGQGTRIAALTVAHAAITILLTVIVISIFGSLAAGIGYLIANAIRLCVVLWFSAQYFSVVANLLKLTQCILPPLISGLLMALILVQSSWLMPVGWIQLIAAYVFVGCTVITVSIATTSLSADGRQMIGETFLDLRSLFKKEN